MSESGWAVETKEKDMRVSVRIGYKCVCVCVYGVFGNFSFNWVGSGFEAGITKTCT